MNHFELVLKVFKAAKPYFMESLSCCEYIDFECMKCVEENLGLKSPIGHYSFYILLECSGADEKEIRLKMEKFLKKAEEEKMIENGVVAQKLEEIDVC